MGPEHQRQADCRIDIANLAVKGGGEEGCCSASHEVTALVLLVPPRGCVKMGQAAEQMVLKCAWVRVVWDELTTLKVLRDPL